MNPNSPSIRGEETQPRFARAYRLDSPLKGVAQQFQASSTNAMSTLHTYLSTIGDKPGLALEVLEGSALVPPTTDTYYFPGTDTGATTTGWETNTNAAATYVSVASFGALKGYLRNSTATAATSTRDLLFRGNSTALNSSRRVLNVALVAVCYLSTSTSNATQVALAGILDIGGTRYVSNDFVFVPRNGRWAVYTVAQWPVSPATDLPWVSTSVDDLWSSTDEFGVRLVGKAAAEGFGLSGFALKVTTCAENRKSYYYLSGAPGVTAKQGWLESAMASSNSLVTSASYWAHLYALNGSAQDYLATRLLRDPDQTTVTDPSKTGEQRKAVTTRLQYQGGNVVSYEAQPTELFPILLDRNGTIDGQSFPYADLTSRTAAEKVGGVDLTGASGTYVSATDSAPLSITSHQAGAVLMAPDDLTPSTNMALLCKWVESGNQRSTRFELQSDGSLSLWNSTNGTSAGSNYTSSVSLTSVNCTNGQAVWVGYALECQVSTNQRTATFYVSTNADPYVYSAWQTLGTAKTSIGYTAVADTTAPLELGSRDQGTVSNFDGAVYRGRLFSGTNNTDVRADVYLYANDSSASSLAAKVTDASVGDQLGNVWSLSGAAAFQRYRFGQAVTTAAATGYAGVRFPAQWATAVAPDAPLTVQIQTGTEGASGRGTVVATGYLFPEDVPDPAGKRVDVLFAGGTWTNTLNTQVWVSFASTAKNGWKIPVQDTRSDDLASGTTLTEVEGATQGAATDGWASPEGIHQARFDVPVALISTVAGASSVSVTALAAA